MSSSQEPETDPHESKEKGAAPPRISPDQTNPLPKESEVILAKVNPQRTGEMSAEERGGTGTHRQVSPDPRDTTNLNHKSRVVA